MDTEPQLRQWAVTIDGTSESAPRAARILEALRHLQPVIATRDHHYGVTLTIAADRPETALLVAHQGLKQAIPDLHVTNVELVTAEERRRRLSKPA
jgi:ADP-dependent phosphofructokinase/glucokinase